MMSKTEDTQPQPTHQVVADGEVIYSGPDWQQAFLEAGLNPEYTAIVHLENGEQGAVLGPVQPHRHPL
jgi:hypothetical protein